MNKRESFKVLMIFFLFDYDFENAKLNKKNKKEQETINGK